MLYNNLDRCMGMLPVNLRQRIQKKSDINAKVCSLGGALLLKMVAEETGTDISKVVYAEKGKPYIPDSDFYFSISHTKGYAAISYGNAPCGCDIQVDKDVNLKIAERFFSLKEQDAVLNINEKQKTFFNIWCRKESAYKLGGQNYCTMENEDNYIFKDFILKNNLFLCVCAADGEISNPKLTDFNTVF